MFAQATVNDFQRASKLERIQFYGWFVYCLANLALVVPLVVVRTIDFPYPTECASIADSLFWHWIGFMFMFGLVLHRKPLGGELVIWVLIINICIYVLSGCTANILYHTWTSCADSMSSLVLHYLTIAMLSIVWCLQLPTFVMWCVLGCRGHVLTTPDKRDDSDDEVDWIYYSRRVIRNEIS